MRHELSRAGGAVLLTAIWLSLTAGAGPADAGGAHAEKEHGRQDERNRMVSRQIAARGIKDKQVLAAMRRVPRHMLMPVRYRNAAYGDHPVPIGYGQTISQPYIVAYMTEILQLKKDSKVLEIGTGSGYQAAVLAEITTNVYTIEIVHELAESAAGNLEKLGYTQVRAREGDGYYGWESAGPWNAVIVTAAAEHIPPPLVKQLKRGGRMCIPVGSQFGVQYLLLVEKEAGGEVSTRNLMPVRFVPLTRSKGARH